MNIRKAIFWAHLAAGIVCGLVIAIMSFTGVLIAFEHEFMDWADRKLIHIEPPSPETRPLPVRKVIDHAEEAIPDFAASYVRIPRDPDKTYQVSAGRTRSVYVNPYTGKVRLPRSDGVHHFMHTMETWHRYLGMKNKQEPLGKLINGICNFMFLLLCISGLYLWFPYKWVWRNVRRNLLFDSSLKGKVRDLNWHNVIGFWNAPVLIILAGTAVIFSFGWGHKLLFAAFGEEAPQYRDFRMMMVPSAPLPEYESGIPMLPLDDLLESVKTHFPEWEAIGIRLAGPPDAPATRPQAMDVYLPALFSTMGYTPVNVDPYSGKILKYTLWEDRSPGIRARVWARFLHTGEAFGLVGKVIATLSTFASLFLVYTGFALTYRRFRRRLRRGPRSS